MIKDLVVSLVVLVGTVIVYVSLQWMEEPRSVIFPRVILTIMAILTVLFILQTLLLKKKSGSGKGKPYPFGRAFLCFALIVVYFMVMEGLGFYFSSFLLFVAVTFILGRSDLTLRKGAIRVGVSIVFMAVLFVLFNKLLLVQTPKGLLF
ncbi:MAG: tripartite tricarboxylate transporter TctB family protein [Deltaproteobacteria bacterium]|nr:tripartite tricarboxylate transporter TctB family protein [Deltaproteobacteria bacterium]